MAINSSKVRGDLGRAKTAANRNEMDRAVQLIYVSLKALGGQQTPMDLRSDFREAINATTSIAEFKKIHAEPVIYAAGKEKELLAVFAHVYTVITGKANEEEAYETAIKRKLSLDRCLKDARALIARGKTADADKIFTEALKFYRDEHILFAMIARDLMEAGEAVRALGYIKQGLKAIPNDPELTSLGQECLKLRAEQGR